MHPYETAPDHKFWSRSVSRDYNPASLLTASELLIRRGDKVATAGSCFASNLAPYLQCAGFTHLRTETIHPSLNSTTPENLGYDQFSASYGNIYTARQLLQLLCRADGKFKPVEDRWEAEDSVLDPFRPGLRYPALSHREFDLLRAQHLCATRRAFAEADVFIFTLGLTEAWLSRSDGAVFPACPGTVSGTFDPEKHAFHNFSVSDVVSDLNEFVQHLRYINPRIRIILTVSPVPLVATATENHVMTASVYSKSVLRVAADEAARANNDVVYFPSYEIVTSSRSPQSFFKDDYRSVSVDAVEEVMMAFLSHCEVGSADKSVRPALLSRDAPALSKALADAECDEVMAGRP
jgi:hypothetical protein